MAIFLRINISLLHLGWEPYKIRIDILKAFPKYQLVSGMEWNQLISLSVSDIYHEEWYLLTNISKAC